MQKCTKEQLSLVMGMKRGEIAVDIPEKGPNSGQGCPGAPSRREMYFRASWQGSERHRSVAVDEETEEHCYDDTGGRAGCRGSPVSSLWL